MTHPIIKAFISYSHEDRMYAGRIKTVLATFGIDAFLAHDDIAPSHFWRERILLELNSCELFVALLSKNFLASKWAPQEIGFIISRKEVKIMPLSLDETVSPGFINHIQSKRFDEDEPTSDLLSGLVHHFPRVILPKLIKGIEDAHSYASAETRMGRLQPYFLNLTPDESKLLAKHCARNNQVWFARECREVFLPDLIRTQGKHMDPKIRHALQHHIVTGEPYDANEDE